LVTSLEFALHHEVGRTQLVEAMNAARRLRHNVGLRWVYKAFEYKQRTQSLLQSFLSDTLCWGRTLLHKSQPTQARQRLTTHLSARTLRQRRPHNLTVAHVSVSGHDEKQMRATSK
jgi:hypothetical protein